MTHTIPQLMMQNSSDDSNTSSSIQQAHFYHLRQGGHLPKANGFSNGCLRIVSCETNYTKSTASVRPYRSSGKMGKTHNITTPLYTLTMCRYITLKIHPTRNDIRFWIPTLETSTIYPYINTRRRTTCLFGDGPTSVYARFAWYFGLSELRHYDL